MACPGCYTKKSFSEDEIEGLVKEQLELETELVSTKVRNRRLAICEGCAMLFQQTCGKCGCFVKFRASLTYQTCPDKKW